MRTLTSTLAVTVALATAAIALPATASAANGSYTMAQVRQHAKPTDCWTVVNRTVYDVTAWVNRHPGGSRAIASMCGKDATRVFRGQHGGQAQPASVLASYRIGTLRR